MEPEACSYCRWLGVVLHLDWFSGDRAKPEGKWKRVGQKELEQ